MPSAQEAQRFLDILGERHTFQTFDDTPGRGRVDLVRVLHGNLSAHASTLARLNEDGAGVFVMVNAGDERGRATENVQRVRALFVDLDGSPLDPIKTASLAPHCVVESSPGRWHAYWRVSDCGLEDFKPLQRALAAQFGGDPVVIDLPRVMRIPGFDHRKGTSFRTRIVEIRESAPYSAAQIRDAFGFPATTLPKQRRTASERIPEGQRNDQLFDLACGLVRRGIGAVGVRNRLQRINAERCDPPLCASEVAEIATRASAYGSEWFTTLPHKLLDSPEWRALPPPAHDVILTAFRRYDGSNNGNIALAWEDFQGRAGFGRKDTFYRHRRLALDSGILRQSREGANSQRGRKPDLFAIADCWLHISPVSKMQPGASIENAYPYIDKQSLRAFAGKVVPINRKKEEAA